MNYLIIALFLIVFFIHLITILQLISLDKNIKILETNVERISKDMSNFWAIHENSTIEKTEDNKE